MNRETTTGLITGAAAFHGTQAFLLSSLTAVKVGPLAALAVTAVESVATVGVAAGLAVPVAVGLAPIAIATAGGAAVFAVTAPRTTAKIVTKTVGTLFKPIAWGASAVVSALTSKNDEHTDRRKTNDDESNKLYKADSNDQSSESYERTESTSNEENGEGDGDAGNGDESDEGSKSDSDSDTSSESTESSSSSEDEEEKHKQKPKTKGSKQKSKNKQPSTVDHYTDSISSESTKTYLPKSGMSELSLKRTSQNIKNTVNGSYHLVRRLTRFLRVGGIVTYIVGNFNIPKTNIFQSGRSETKDRVCKDIPDHHAAHVVQLQVVPSVLECNPLIYKILRKCLGHTHFVHKIFNLCIGKRIDTLQGKLLQALLSIDWHNETADNISSAAVTVLQMIRDLWIELITQEMSNLNYTTDQRRELSIACQFISNMTITELFEKVIAGLDYMIDQMRKQNKQM
ncbi:uncharacterized protein LOC120413274 [Culex pipiens pallens]|uniref:uncharacterized protein LOC120413274 n=1 Tax=Culex pipiens pallens TaxID=42434 RepID=UPI0022AA1E58|nr:uncharacterized protein LOC120413274 [Culex pipiens pallens]